MNSICLTGRKCQHCPCSLTIGQVGSVQPMESAITVRKVRLERSLAGRPTVKRGKEGTFFLTTSCQGLAFRRQSSAQPSHTVATNVTASSSSATCYGLDLQSCCRYHFSGNAGPFGRDTYDFFSFLCINSPGLADDDDDDEAHAHHHHQQDKAGQGNR